MAFWIETLPRVDRSPDPFGNSFAGPGRRWLCQRAGLWRQAGRASPAKAGVSDQRIDRWDHRQRQHGAGHHAADHGRCNAAHHFGAGTGAPQDGQQAGHDGDHRHHLGPHALHGAVRGGEGLGPNLVALGVLASRCQINGGGISGSPTESGAQNGGRAWCVRKLLVLVRASSAPAILYFVCGPTKCAKFQAAMQSTLVIVARAMCEASSGSDRGTKPSDISRLPNALTSSCRASTDSSRKISTGDESGLNSQLHVNVFPDTRT